MHQLREAFAAQVELVRRASSAPPPSPPSQVAEPASQAGTGTNASPEQILVGAVMEVLLQAGKAAVEAAVLHPAADWWQTKGQAMMGERRERWIQKLEEGLDRHPELYVCAKDDVVFVPGGKSTMPTRKAVELLLRGDDGRLMSTLSS